MQERSQASTEPNATTAAIVYLSISRGAILKLLALASVGGVASIAGALMYTSGQRRLMLAYLIAFGFVLSLSIGSLFFVLIQHLTRSGWAVLIRRPAEVFAMNIATVALLALPIVWSVFSGPNSIYPWANGHASQSHESHIGQPLVSTRSTATFPEEMYVHQSFDELTASKTNWLNPTFFVVRLSIYFGLWLTIAAFYFFGSRYQDFTGGAAQTRRMEWWSGPATFLFAISLTFAAFDLLMSLDPHWYSTIFGVYFFAGCAVGGFAVSLLSWLVLAQWKVAPLELSDEHFRDLGRLMFAFIFFWGYIAFSQYMLLWYANIPETTRWWVVRGASLADGYRNSWGILLVVLLFGHFIIPFLGIMSRHVKGHRPSMIFWTIWMLAMHYLDLLWLVMPELGPRLVFGLPELGTLLLVASVYLLGASYLATRTPMIPVGDPRLSSSLSISEAY